jgi:hypothetical protein
MKKYIFILTIILSFLSFSQIYDPHRFEMAFSRIEQAFETASPGNLWPLISYPITIRIEDSLYQDISDIQAEKVLKEFFQNKDSVEFRVAGQNGVLTYVEDKKKKSLNVDIYLEVYKGDIFISALNISNYPSAMVFFNFSK